MNKKLADAAKVLRGLSAKASKEVNFRDLCAAGDAIILLNSVSHLDDSESEAESYVRSLLTDELRKIEEKIKIALDQMACA